MPLVFFGEKPIAAFVVNNLNRVIMSTWGEYFRVTTYVHLPPLFSLLSKQFAQYQNANIGNRLAMVNPTAALSAVSSMAARQACSSRRTTSSHR